MWIFKKIVNAKNLPLLLFHAIFSYIAFVNFPAGKFFIGWDALSPEFNLSLNFQRSIFASWQENYGLGALTGHGFATQLPHTMIISLLSFLLPLWSIRPVFIFLCLYLGGLGMYFFTRLLLYKITFEEYQRKFLITTEYICLLTALLYITSLATVQMFYLPLEAFIVHFAALPWLFWIIIRLVGKTDKINVVLFFVINFFSSIQGFIPSLFVVYVISLVLFAFVYILINRFSFIVIKKSVLVLLLTVLINSYWLLPFSYYQLSHGNITQIAYNNLMSTEDFILKNKKFGNLESVALMKGYSFDMQELGGYVFQPWVEHYDKPGTKFIGYSLFIFVLISALTSLVLIRHVLIKIATVIFIFFLTSLATDFPLFSYFSRLMQTLSPSYYQAFRTAFTKFALGYSFLFSLFFGLGLYILLGYFYRLLKHKLISLFVFLGLLSLLVYYAFPIYKGNLLYNKLQVDIPKAYFEVIDFFKNQKDGRVADFPVGCSEGWFAYNWGYFGSGFYWYGIKQPILARTFDVWNSSGENYYWEISNAIYSGRFTEVKKILDKYNVKWIIYDQNLLHCRNSKALIGNDEFLDYILSSSDYKLLSDFRSENNLPVLIFELADYTKNKYILINTNLHSVNPKYSWNNYDAGYLENGEYITVNSEQITDNKKEVNTNYQLLTTNNQIYYPFRSLFTGRKQEELEFRIEDSEDYFSFMNKIPTDLVGSDLIIPPVRPEDVEEIDVQDPANINFHYPQIFLDDERVNFEAKNATPSAVSLTYIKDGNFEVRVPKIRGYYSYDIQPTTYNTSTSLGAGLQPRNCDQFNNGEYLHERVREEGKEWLRLTSVGSSNCLDFDLPNLSQDIGYLVTVEGRNIEGKSLLFSVINKNSQRADLETYLPKSKEVEPPKRFNLPEISYFILPPMEKYAVGYTLHFDNISIGRAKTVNDLGKITVSPIPYRFLTALKIIKNDNLTDSQLTTHNSQLIFVDHPNPSYYKIQITNNHQQIINNQHIVLSQSYDKGWHAYQIQNSKSNPSISLRARIQNFFKYNFPFLFEEELRDHVLVNNWENGWNIGSQLSAVGNQSKIDPTTNNQQPTTIVIVYLPQYLEYLGFALLLLIPIIIKLTPSK